MDGIKLPIWYIITMSNILAFTTPSSHVSIEYFESDARARFRILRRQKMSFDVDTICGPNVNAVTSSVLPMNDIE